MESLDFVYDLVDGMEKQDIQYFVLAIREGKRETKERMNEGKKERRNEAKKGRRNERHIEIMRERK